MMDIESQNVDQCSDLWRFLTAEVEREIAQGSSTTNAQTICTQYFSLPLDKKIIITFLASVLHVKICLFRIIRG